MAKQKFTKGTTKAGEALYAHIFKTEVIEGIDTGKYSIMLKLNKKDMEALNPKIEEEWTKYKETLKGKKFEGKPYLGVREYKDEEYFRFTTKAEIKLKTGERLNKTVPLYDAKGVPITEGLKGIGNGSIIKVAYLMIPFYKTKTIYGVSLCLEAIQIIDLVEFGNKTAEDFGFGVEEGYSHDEAQENNEDALDEVIDDDEEGDF